MLMVIGGLAIQAAPASGAASGQLLVASESGLTPIDTATNAAGSTLTKLDGFGPVAITPDGSTAYAVQSGGPIADDDVVQFQMTASGPAEETKIPLSAASYGGTPSSNPIITSIAIAPNGRTAYLADTDNSVVLPLDLTQSPPAFGTAIPVPAGATDVAVSPDSATVYVLGAGKITPISASTGTLGSVITVTGDVNTESFALTPDGSEAYVAAGEDAYPVTLASGHVGAPIDTGVELTNGDGVKSFAIASDGATGYAAGASQSSGETNGDPTVVPIDLATATAETAIDLSTATSDTEASLFAIALTPDGSTAYVSYESYTNGVVPIDTATGTAGTAISIGSGSVGSGDWFLAITPAQAPVPAFTATPAVPGSPTAFDASASTVTSGSITNYEWNFGDGSAAVNTSSPTTSHVYSTGGDYTVTLTETDSDGGVAQTSQLVVIGGGAQPAVSLSAGAFDFGSETLKLTTATKLLTVTNTGAAPLEIGPVTLAGTDPADFAITADTCESQTIAAGHSCSAELAFTPTQTGARSARLTLSDNATGSPQTVSLTGTGSFRVAFAGTVSYLGGPIGGATVQACPTGAGLPGDCFATQTARDGSFSLSIPAPAGADYALTAYGAPGDGAGEQVISPLAVQSATVTGIEIALPALPAVPPGVTVISPSHGTLTSTAPNPEIYWDEPTEVEFARSVFPAGGTVVLTEVRISGTDLETGEPMTKVVDVGGSVEGDPVGEIVGPGGADVTIPPLEPIHGQSTIQTLYQYFPPGTFSPTGISSTQTLYEIYPTPTGYSPTDPLPAYFLNIGETSGVTLGPGSITGTNASAFSIVPLSSYGVPPDTPDCGSTPAALQQWDQVGSTPPASSECGIAVQFTPPANATQIFYYATLNVAAHGGGQGGTMHVTLLGCDDNIASESVNAAGGADVCNPGSPPPPEEPPPTPPPPIPLPFVWIDPSGTVLATTGHGPAIPLSGAVVTVLSSHTKAGPFRAVPNNSDVMSPSNRRNPDHTGILGSFGWDVLPGYYRVSATHAGCTAIGHGKQALSRVLSIPPAALNIGLELRCPKLTRARTHIALSARAAPMHEITLSARVRGKRPGGLVSFLLGRRLLGTVPLDPRHGTASLTVRGSTTHGFVAEYQGDADDAPSSARG